MLTLVEIEMFQEKVKHVARKVILFRGTASHLDALTNQINIVKLFFSGACVTYLLGNPLTGG